MASSNPSFSFYLSRITGFLLLCILGIVFLVSGITKLYAFEQLVWNIMDVGVGNMLAAGIIARLLISFELILGAFLLLHLYLKSFTYPLVIVMLIFFSIYLIFLINTQGDGGNCGCFGEAYKMKPSAGILKNIILLGITAVLWVIYPIKPYKFSFGIALLIAISAITIPFITSPVGLGTNPEKVQEQINLDPLYGLSEPPSVDLKTGKHIVSFMSLTCPHCKKAATLLHIIKKQHPDFPIYFILVGKDEYLNDFFKETKANEIPYYHCKDIDVFIPYAKDGVPAIYWINNSIIERKANYYQLNPQTMQDWLQE